MRNILLVVFNSCWLIIFSQGLDLGTLNYSPIFVANLSNINAETSGLVYINDTLFSINDSGNQPVINAFKSIDGQHLASWLIQDASNIDWEALALSPDHFFIGDIGNNAGTRTTFDIYMFPREAILSGNTTLVAQKRTFQFADQPNVPLSLNDHDYDCEAMFFWQDSLHLLTKNWQNLWTRHYVIPTEWQDTIVVSPRDSFNVNGLITDATLDASTGNIYLLGYKKELSGLYSSFMYRFENTNGSFFNSDYRRIELGSTLNLGQTEGLCFGDANKGWISGEQINSIITISPKLHSFDFNELLHTTKLPSRMIYFHENILYIPTQFLKEYALIDTSGRRAIEWKKNKSEQELSSLRPGIYYLVGPNFHQTWVKSN